MTAPKVRANEIEEKENEFIDNATTALTLSELKLEIETLKELEILSKSVVDAGTDSKWQELKRILDDELMVDPNGARRKLVLFTEFVYDLPENGPGVPSELNNIPKINKNKTFM